MPKETNPIREVDEEAINQGRSVPLSDLAALRDYIHQFRSATAVFCGSAQRAKDLVRLCDALGVLVPDDLSVASAGASAMRDDMTGGQLTGFGFAPEDLADAAVSMLSGILENGTSRFSQVKVPPRTYKGNSAGEPRRAKQTR